MRNRQIMSRKRKRVSKRSFFFLCSSDCLRRWAVFAYSIFFLTYYHFYLVDLKVVAQLMHANAGKSVYFAQEHLHWARSCGQPLKGGGFIIIIKSMLILHSFFFFEICTHRCGDEPSALEAALTGLATASCGCCDCCEINCLKSEPSFQTSSCTALRSQL